MSNSSRLKVDYCSSVNRLESGNYVSENSRIQYVTFFPAKPANADFLLQLEVFRQLLLNKKIKTEKRHTNYEESNFDFLKQEAITLVFFDNVIVGFSTIYRNPFYPEKVARVLNRFFLDSDFRKSRVKSGNITHSINMLLHQLIVARQLNLDLVFMSTELFKPRFMRAWTLVANQITKTEWINPEEAFMVCQNKNAFSCWQHVAFTKLNQDAQILFVKEEVSKILSDFNFKKDF